MIGTILAGAASLASGIAGGIKSAKAARNARKKLERQANENQAWYDRRYNEDATQRADAQRLLNLTEESIRNRNRAVAGTQAVMGGTEASTAAAKEANARALSDTTAQIAAAGEARKDAIESQYMANKQAIEGQQMQADMAKSQAIADATKLVGQSIASGAKAIDEYGRPEIKTRGYNVKERFKTDRLSDNTSQDVERINKKNIGTDFGLPPLSEYVKKRK